MRSEGKCNYSGRSASRGNIISPIDFPARNRGSSLYKKEINYQSVLPSRTIAIDSTVAVEFGHFYSISGPCEILKTRKFHSHEC